MYGYAANNPIKYIDPDGESDVYFIVKRNDDSKYSPFDKSKRALDTVIFKNSQTGDWFALYNVQTFVSYFDEKGEPVYSLGNSLMAYCFGFDIQYLGDNEKDKELYGGFVSKFKGPVFNIQDAQTMWFGRTDDYGVAADSDDKTPYRVHSNFIISRDAEVPKASGGCLVYDWKQAEKFAEFLERNGVKPGDVITGCITEYFEP